jgi:hypothetical protein
MHSSSRQKQLQAIDGCQSPLVNFLGQKTGAVQPLTLASGASPARVCHTAFTRLHIADSNDARVSRCRKDAAVHIGKASRCSIVITSI